MMIPRISAILLAAGLSQRMGEDKLLLPYKKKPLLQNAIDLLSDLHIYEKILVTTASRLERVKPPPEINVILNPQPETGQGGSVRLGVMEATGEWYLFMAADQPLLGIEDLLPILEAAKESNGKIIYPMVNGNPSTPSLFSSSFREELLSLYGDAGGRVVRTKHPEACFEIIPQHPECFYDVDTIEDYRELHI